MDEVAVSSFSAKRNKPNLAAIKNVAGSVSKTVKKVTSLAARKEDDGDVNDLHNKEIDDDEFDNYFSSLEIIEKPANKSKRNRRVSMTLGHSSNTNGDSAQWQFSVDAFGDSFDDSSSDEENDVRTQEQQQAQHQQQQQQQQQQPEKAISTIEKSSATKAKAQKDKKSSVLEAGVKKNRQKMQGSLDECITMELPLDSFLSNNNKNSNSLDKSSRSGGKNSKKSSIKSSDSRKSKKSAKSLPVLSQSRTIPRKSFWQFSSSDDDDDLHTSTHSTMSATRKRRSSLSSAKKDCLGTSTHSTMTATRRKRRSSKKEMETSAHSTRSASRRKTPSSSKKDGSSSTTPLRRRSSKTSEANQDADDDDRIDSAMNKFSPGRQRLGNKDDPPVTPVRQRSRSIEIKVDKTDEDDNTDSVISAGSKRSGRRKKEQSIRRRSKKDEVDNDAGSIVSACSKRSGKKKSLRRRSKKDKIEQDDDDDDNDETGSIISAGSKRSRKKNRTPTRRRSKGGEFKHGHGGDNHKTDAGSVVSTGSRRGRKREKLRSGRRICSSAEKKEGVMDDKQVVDETSDDDSDSFAVDKTNDSLLTKQNVRQEDNDRTENIVDNPQDALASPTKSKSKSARFRTASKSVEKGYDASSKGKNENAERNNQSRKLRIAAILNQRMVEVEEIEQILEEDRLSMVQEREELLDERNKLKSKLYEKIQKNEFLQGIIDRGLNFSMDSDKNDTEDSTDDDDDDDNEKADDHQNFLGERVACENEELEAQIQAVREDYRVEAHKLESEIQDLHTSIKKKLRSANGDPLAISMHKANGDLLRTRSNLSNLDSTIQREQALIDELTMELQGYRHGSVTQALEQEIADLKAENEEVELEFETEKNEIDETLKGKGETLALLINQLEKLKQQQEAPPPPPTVAESPFSFVKRLTSVVGATMGQPSNDALPPDDSFLDKSERSVEATFKTLFGSSPESVLAARRKAARPPASDSSMPIL